MENVISNELPVLYNVNDIQKIFKIGRSKAYELMNSSGFPSMRLNKKLYVSKENLENWIRKQTGKSYSYGIQET